MTAPKGLAPTAPQTCPVCGQAYTGKPALSREDNSTLICPDCGTRQALAAMGMGGAEQEAVIERIHNYEAHKARKEEQA